MRRERDAQQGDIIITSCNKRAQQLALDLEVWMWECQRRKQSLLILAGMGAERLQ